MDQVSAASRFFAKDAWVQSLDWRADDQVLQVTIANRQELRAGRFVLPVSVQLLVPTNEHYPYMWFAAGSHGACRSVQRILETANSALEKDTIASVGLVAVVSSLVLQFKDQAAIIWPTHRSKNTGVACSDASGANVGGSEAHSLPDGLFEHSVSSAEQTVIATAITGNLRGCELLLLLLQLGANSAGFERLCSPFPESFRDSATGRYQVARLRNALVAVPPLHSIPSIVRRFYSKVKGIAATADGLNSAGRGAASSTNEREFTRDENRAGAGKESDGFEGALAQDVALLLFWVFSYAPFCLRPTQMTQDDAKNIPPHYESFDILHRSRVPNFNAQATMHGQMRVRFVDLSDKNHHLVIRTECSSEGYMIPFFSVPSMMTIENLLLRDCCSWYCRRITAATHAIGLASSATNCRISVARSIRRMVPCLERASTLRVARPWCVVEAPAFLAWLARAYR